MKKYILILLSCLVLVACSDDKAEPKKLKAKEESPKTENPNAAEETQNSENTSSTEVSQNAENNSSTEEETEYIAKASYFKEIVLRNDEGQFISFDPDGAYIVANYSFGNKTDLDTVIEKDSPKGDGLKKNYKDITIETDGSMYYIKLTDEITLQFERIGERTFKDSLGIRYYAQDKQ